jgi:hypothetical protein
MGKIRFVGLCYILLAEENFKMLKRKIWLLAPAATLFLLLSPTRSQAASTGFPLFDADVTMSLFDKLAGRLDVLAGGAKGQTTRTLRTTRTPRTPAPHVTILQKHGCGIDPQGQPYCMP